MAEVIQLGRTAAADPAARSVLERLAEEFRRNHWIRLGAIFEPAILQRVLAGIDAAAFDERVHEGIGPNRELCLEPSPVVGLLHVLVNAEALFALVEAVTGCAKIQSFQGRVYRVVPGCGHHDHWHDDMGNEKRLVAMSINLSPVPYSGGTLQIRRKADRESLQEVANIGLGDAIVFRLSRDLQHRISDVDGAHAKTAFAGWFRSDPVLRTSLASLRQG